MPFQSLNPRNDASIGLGNKKLIGLESFKNSIEKHFFAKVILRESFSDNHNVSLILEIQCNLSFTEMLQHFKLGTWGGFDTSDSGLVKSLKQLRTINNRIIDIEELSFYLNDTSVIVNKIYEDSILEQLERILKKLASHQFHLTKGMTEVPYEIFVPVFEEIFLDEEAILQERKAGYNSKLDYFKFWGLYFYSEEDAVIYDVKKKAIISGNLQTFNI